jgi:Sulfotransferase domain
MKNNKNDFKVDFIGIGAAKCATSWAYKCLIEHPQVCGPLKKELHFFLQEKPPFSIGLEEHSKFLYKKGISFYAKYFNHCKKNSIKGEFSVSYIADPNAASLIKKHFPDIKIIAILRDPTKRAYSLYWFAKEFRLREKNATFEDALKNKSDAYIKSGMYYQQLKPYLNLFPRENIGIFFVDDLKKDPKEFIQKMYKFLDVNESYIPPSIDMKENAAKSTRFKVVKKIIESGVSGASNLFKKIHIYFIVDYLRKLNIENFIYTINNKINVKSFVKPPINPETEKKLRKIFKRDIEMVEKITNKNLNNWK